MLRTELVAVMDHSAADFAEQVYAVLAERYAELVLAQ